MARKKWRGCVQGEDGGGTERRGCVRGEDAGGTERRREGRNHLGDGGEVEDVLALHGLERRGEVLVRRHELLELAVPAVPPRRQNAHATVLQRSE